MNANSLVHITLGIIFFTFSQSIECFSTGDRVSTLIRTHHDGFKSPWMDLSLHQMPKFQSPDGSLLQTVLPRRSEKEPEMKLNPKEDVKISMVFAGSKLVIPLILLFDSKHKRSLKSLTVTFSHDDFDITKLEYETVYAAPIVRLDPSHPSLMAFDIVYRWEAVHGNDLRLGVVTMFVSTLLLFVLLICYIFYSYDRDIATPKVPAHGSNTNARRPQGSAAPSGYGNSR